MKFPNAAKGISKIFTSEILALIAAIATGVASILAAVMYASAKTNSTAGAAASGIGIQKPVPHGPEVLPYLRLHIVKPFRHARLIRMRRCERMKRCSIFHQ